MRALAIRTVAVFLLPLLLAGGLSGCKLIDQTTFAPDPEPSEVPAPAPVTAAPRPTGRAPLMTIRYDTATPAYRDALAQAVTAVEQRRPGASFDVVGASDAAGAAQAGRDAGSVLATLRELGVAAGRLHLGARIEPTATVREVRVYLR